MRRYLLRLVHSQDGATAIEYGMIAGLVFLAIVGSVQALGTGVAGMLYSKIQAAL